MYNRYIRGGDGSYNRVSSEDAPLPPPLAPRQPPPPPKESSTGGGPAGQRPPPGGAPESRRTGEPPAPVRSVLNGLLEKLRLSDLDAGDILLLLLLFFLFRQEADEELLIAIGLLLIL